eukprot:6190126-Pleurochrysis_carterae.AAC.1
MVDMRWNACSTASIAACVHVSSAPLTSSAICDSRFAPNAEAESGAQGFSTATAAAALLALALTLPSFAAALTWSAAALTLPDGKRSVALTPLRMIRRTARLMLRHSRCSVSSVRPSFHSVCDASGGGRSELLSRPKRMSEASQRDLASAGRLSSEAAERARSFAASVPTSSPSEALKRHADSERTLSLEEGHASRPMLQFKRPIALSQLLVESALVARRCALVDGERTPRLPAPLISDGSLDRILFKPRFIPPVSSTLASNLREPPPGVQVVLLRASRSGEKGLELHPTLKLFPSAPPSPPLTPLP